MYLSVFFFTISAILISPLECYHHYRNKLHRRQMPQIPQQIPQHYNSLKQPNSQFPVAYPMYPPSFALNRLRNRNSGFSYGNPYEPPEPYFGNEAIQTGNVPVSNSNVGSLPGNNDIPSDNVTVPPANISISLVKNTELLIQSSPLKNAEVKTKANNFSPFPELGIFPEFSSTFMGEAQPAFSNYRVPIQNYRKSVLSAPSYSKPNRIDGSRRRITSSKRRKKNIGEYDDSLLKFFEKQKKLLKLSTTNDLTTENSVITGVTTDNYSSETDTIGYSTTLVPLPKGIQVKSVEKHGDSLVHANANISSSTQKIITYDNNTEVENVIEMDMERKIEDGKGADKGYEEIRIIEKERVKPIVISKISKVRRGRRKNHKNNFFEKRNKLLELSTVSHVTTPTDLTTDNDFSVDNYVTTDNDLTSNNYGTTADNDSGETDGIIETEKVKPIYTSETSKFFRRRKNHKNNSLGKQKKQLEVPTVNDLTTLTDVTTDNDVTIDNDVATDRDVATDNDFTGDDDFSTDNDFATDNYVTIDDHSDDIGTIIETERVKPILKSEKSKFPNKRRESKKNNFSEKEKLFELSTKSDFANIADGTTDSNLITDNDITTDNDFIPDNDLRTDDDVTPDNYSDETGALVETESVKPMFKSKTSKFHNTRRKRKNNNFVEKENKLLEPSTLNDLATIADDTTDLITDNDVTTDKDFITDNDFTTDDDFTVDNHSAETGAIGKTERTESMFKSKTSKFHNRRSESEKNSFFEEEKKPLELPTISDIATVADVTTDSNFITDKDVTTDSNFITDNDATLDNDLKADNDFITDNDVTSDNYSDEAAAIVETESAKPMVKSKLSEFHRRRRKSYKNKFFEKEKKQLKLPTVKYLSTNNDAHANDNSDETDTMNYSTTLLQLPEGIQLKAVTKYGNSIIRTAVNISSSTQKIISYDNNTEVDNFIKMKMLEKIEDEKGANKGYEKVQIVEKKKVKPVIKSKIHRRRRKDHKNRFFTHHRSKRSSLSSDEVPRSKSLYNKMAQRFLLAVKRKERVAEPDDTMNRDIIPDFQEMNQKTTTGNTKQMIDNSIYDKKEMGYLMNLFSNVMKKFRKSRENKTNINIPNRRTCKDCTGFKLLPHKMRKLKRTSPYPKPMNFIMNIWDSKMKDRVAKSIKTLKGYETVRSENTSSAESTSELNSMTPKYVKEKQSARLLTAVLFFSVMTCFVAVLALVLPKSYKWIKLNRMKSAMKNYPLYDGYPKNRAKEIESKNLLPQDNQELEWQSENGDWLSEK